MFVTSLFCENYSSLIQEVLFFFALESRQVHKVRCALTELPQGALINKNSETKWSTHHLHNNTGPLTWRFNHQKPGTLTQKQLHHLSWLTSWLDMDWISLFTGLPRWPDLDLTCICALEWPKCVDEVVWSAVSGVCHVLTVSWCQWQCLTCTGTSAAGAVSVTGLESQVTDWSVIWSSGTAEISCGEEVTLVLSITSACDRQLCAVLSESTGPRSVKGPCPSLTVTGERWAVRWNHFMLLLPVDL